MLLSPDVMRVLLLVCMAGMLVLAGLSLRHRQLSTAQTLTWGALMVLLPLIGPFLVILFGGKSKDPRRTARERRLHRATIRS